MSDGTIDGGGSRLASVAGRGGRLDGGAKRVLGGGLAKSWHLLADCGGSWGLAGGSGGRAHGRAEKGGEHHFVGLREDACFCRVKSVIVVSMIIMDEGT